MSIYPKIFAAIAAGAILGFIPAALADVSAIGFKVNVTVGDATATGYFTGVIGNTSGDVGAPFDLTLTEGLTSDRLLASPTGSGDGEVSAGNSDAITVTADNVYFNFSDPNPDYLKFYASGQGGPSDTVLCFQTYAICGGTGAGIVIDVKGASDPFQSMTGNQIIASVGSVPELSTWAMLLLGFSGLGFAWHWRNGAHQHA